MTYLSIIFSQTNFDNPHIIKTLKSIESQTFTDYEIITYNTLSSKPYFQKYNSKIKSKISFTNTKKLSEIIRIAKGTYILFLDEKHQLHSENTIKTFITRLENDNLEVLQSITEEHSNNISLKNLFNYSFYKKEFIKNMTNTLKLDTPFLSLYFATNTLMNLKNYKTINKKLINISKENQMIHFENKQEIYHFIKSIKYVFSNLKSTFKNNTYISDFSKNFPIINYNHIPRISKNELKQIKNELHEISNIISNKEDKLINYYISKYFRTLYDMLYNQNTNFDTLISIIIPTYNVEKYIDDCFTSLLKQNLKNIEIICVDDQSTDSTTEIIKYYQQKDKRIKYYQVKNKKGSGGCRNYGLKKARGKYVQFMDSDDFLDLNALNELYNLAEKEKTQILMFKATSYFHNKNKFIIESYYKMGQNSKYLNQFFGIDDIENIIVFKTVVSPWNKLYLKSFLTSLNVKFPENLIHQDNPFFFETFLNADRIYLLDKYYYNRRHRDNSITTLNNHVELGVIEIIELILKVFFKYGLYEKYKKPLLNKLLNKFDRRYTLIHKGYKEEFYKRSKDKIDKFSNQYNLKEDLNTCLNTRNKKLYELLLTTKNYKEFKLKWDLFIISRRRR